MTVFTCPHCGHIEEQPTIVKSVSHWCEKAHKHVELKRT